MRGGRGIRIYRARLSVVCISSFGDWPIRNNRRYIYFDRACRLVRSHLQPFKTCLFQPKNPELACWAQVRSLAWNSSLLLECSSSGPFIQLFSNCSLFNLCEIFLLLVICQPSMDYMLPQAAHSDICAVPVMPNLECGSQFYWYYFLFAKGFRLEIIII